MSEDVKMSSAQRAVQERILPHLQRVVEEANAMGLPFLAIIQTPGMLVEAVDMATICTNVTGFSHPCARRFLIDFFSTAYGDPGNSDWGPAQRELSDAFVCVGTWWAQVQTEGSRRSAVSAALNLWAEIKALPRELYQRTMISLSAVLGPERAGKFTRSLEAARAEPAAAPSGDTTVEASIPPGLPLLPGTN